MKLVILIPTFNRKQILMRGLIAIYQAIETYNEKSNYLDIKIIVINDGSKDGTGEMLNDLFGKSIVLNGDGNYWWSKAINTGAKYAIEEMETDYVLLWNDDVFPKEDYFIQLEIALGNNKQGRILGSTVLDYKTNKLWATTMTFNKFTGKMNYINKNFNPRISYKWLTGMGVIVHSSVVKKLNYWDNINFPQYFGDVDFTLRAYKMGYELETLQDLVIFNQTELSSFKGTDFKTFISSLKQGNIGSRYNMGIRRKLLKKHCESKFWFLSYSEFYLKYFVKTFILKKYQD